MKDLVCALMATGAMMGGGAMKVDERNVIPSVIPRVIENKKIETGILQSFYAKQERRMVWFPKCGPNEKLNDIIALVAKSEEDGLRPENYNVVEIQQRLMKKEYTPETDILVSNTLAKYMRDISVGRVSPEKIDPDMFLQKRSFDNATALYQLSKTASPIEFLKDLIPKHPEYQRLKEWLPKLQELKKNGGFIEVPFGPKLHAKAQIDERISLLRKRLAQEGFDVGDQEKYAWDEKLEEAVKLFQESYGLNPDGIAGFKTISLLNVSVDEYIKRVIISMERWRWLPESFEPERVVVNIPAYQMQIYSDGKLLESMKAIVGKREHQTPIFKSVITDVTFTPYWHVTKRLFEEVFMPRILANPNIMETQGFELFHIKAKGGTERVDLDYYDAYPNANYLLRQKPGKKNALGRVRFGIKNNWDIYMHDTAEAQLFDSDARSLSSGCIRLQKPLELADFLLDGKQGFDRQKIENLYNKDGEEAKPYRIELAKHLPVYVLYFTAWVDDSGVLHVRDDIYDRDEPIAIALGLEEKVQNITEEPVEAADKVESSPEEAVTPESESEQVEEGEKKDTQVQ
jgi:L,D-transpeptidase YcbB